MRTLKWAFSTTCWYLCFSTISKRLPVSSVLSNILFSYPLEQAPGTWCCQSQLHHCTPPLGSKQCLFLIKAFVLLVMMKLPGSYMHSPYRPTRQGTRIIETRAQVRMTECATAWVSKDWTNVYAEDARELSAKGWLDSSNRWTLSATRCLVQWKYLKAASWMEEGTKQSSSYSLTFPVQPSIYDNQLRAFFFKVRKRVLLPVKCILIIITTSGLSCKN